MENMMLTIDVIMITQCCVRQILQYACPLKYSDLTPFAIEQDAGSAGTRAVPPCLSRNSVRGATVEVRTSCDHQGGSRAARGPNSEEQPQFCRDQPHRLAPQAVRAGLPFDARIGATLDKVDVTLFVDNAFNSHPQMCRIRYATTSDSYPCHLPSADRPVYRLPCRHYYA
jgi:hypothetical protein